MRSGGARADEQHQQDGPNSPPNAREHAAHGKRCNACPNHPSAMPETEPSAGRCDHSRVRPGGSHEASISFGQPMPGKGKRCDNANERENRLSVCHGQSSFGALPGGVTVFPALAGPARGASG